MNNSALVHLSLELDFIDRRSQTRPQASDDVHFVTSGAFCQALRCSVLNATDAASHIHDDTTATAIATATDSTGRAVGPIVVVVGSGYCRKGRNLDFFGKFENGFNIQGCQARFRIDGERYKRTSRRYTGGEIVGAFI